MWYGMLVGVVQTVSLPDNYPSARQLRRGYAGSNQFVKTTPAIPARAQSVLSVVSCIVIVLGAIVAVVFVAPFVGWRFRPLPVSDLRQPAAASQPNSSPNNVLHLHPPTLRLDACDQVAFLGVLLSMVAQEGVLVPVMSVHL